MKRIALIVAVIVLIAVLGIAAFLFLAQDTSEPTPGPDVLFPNASSTGQTLRTTTIPTRSGETLIVHDFITNGVTKEDTINPGTYYLAGRDPLCELSMDCYAGAPADDFTIVYHVDERAFAIGLTKEPLGEARRHAEQFLLKTLGIEQSELCAINYFLTTDEGTNPQYAGSDLGFSFCEGAVLLP